MDVNLWRIIQENHNLAPVAMVGEPSYQILAIFKGKGSSLW